MTRTLKWVWPLALVFLTGVILSFCARSQKHEEEQQTYEGNPYSYYNKKDGSPVQISERVASMGQPKKRIVVFNFWNDTPAKYPGLERFAADELRRNLHLSKRMIVPTDEAMVQDTKDYVQGDNVMVRQVVTEGRRMGAAVLVIGKVARIVFRSRGDDVGLLRQVQSLAAADLEIKIFDISGGREIKAVGRSGEASSSAMAALEKDALSDPAARAELAKLAIRDAAAKLTPDIMRAVEKMAWQGSIAKVTGGKIYINAGRRSGLVSGDILKVLAPGDEVYDPNSGAYLGRTDGQLKGTLEVMDFIGDDAAVSEIHTGANFQQGDEVRLY